MDWGSASPGCVLWGAALPDGRAHIFDELKFQRMTVKEVADAIREKHAGWGVTRMTVYADPALRADTGQIGESIGQTFARYRVPLTYPSNARVSGWQRVHEALSASPAGDPWLTVHPRCAYLIRTLPSMIQSKNDPEDLDTETDDHACDALRYLLMGGLRPSAPRVQPAPMVPYSMAWFRARFADRPQGVLA